MAANTPWAMPCKLRRAAGRRLRSAAWGAGARPAPLRAAETWRGPRLDEVLAPHAGMRMPRPGERDASDPGRGTSGLPAGRLFEVLDQLVGSGGVEHLAAAIPAPRTPDGATDRPRDG